MIKVTDYWAPWCGPCKIMNPIIQELEKEFPNVVFEKINVDENLEKVQEAGIMSVPTFIIEKDGKIIFHKSGAISKDRLEQYLS